MIGDKESDYKIVTVYMNAKNILNDITRMEKNVDLKKLSHVQWKMMHGKDLSSEDYKLLKFVKLFAENIDDAHSWMTALSEMAKREEKHPEPAEAFKSGDECIR